jgi:hypothetical protein
MILTDAQKLQLVIDSISLPPEFASIATGMLIVEFKDPKKMEPDKEVMEVLMKASGPIQYLFIVGGLMLLHKSQEAMMKGWAPSEKELAELKEALPDSLKKNFDKAYESVLPKPPEKKGGDDEIPGYFRN